MPCWRVFPWNAGAADGAPFSARYVPPAGAQAGGRFDLGVPALLYLAQSPTHALAELLQAHRGKHLTSEHLVRSDPHEPGRYHPLSLVSATLPAEVEARLPDLTDPEVLLELDVRPDQLASHDREVTRAISRRVHAHSAAYPGLRWWSALTGEWHATVLFLDRVDVRSIDYTSPEALDIGHPSVVEAARFLGMSLPVA
jgi:RES domain-containing protein